MGARRDIPLKPPKSWVVRASAHVLWFARFFWLRVSVLGFGALVLGIAIAVFWSNATAHFLLNVNIRVFHAVHETDGLRLFVRTPMPYLVVGRTDPASAVRAGRVPQPAPYTYNRLEGGALMHYFDRAEFSARPHGLGELLADGIVIQSRGRTLQARVGEVRVWSAVRQPPFAQLSEVRQVFSTASRTEAEAHAETFVGDSVVDVELFYPSEQAVGAYTLRSTLAPGLPRQEETANLVIDYGNGTDAPVIFRTRGLMLEPLKVSRSAWKAAWTFLREGVHHIFGGIDHLLFVLCLLLGATTFVGLAWRITGFTIGHSLTMPFGVFGYVPKVEWFVPLIELGIALSIIYVAWEALARRVKSATLPITTALGLLHGLGFSFVLKEILRVDSPNLWQSLAGFNIGVEVGQLFIAALVWPLLWYLTKNHAFWRHKLNWAIATPCIVIAAIWSGERTVLVWTAIGF